MDELKNMINPNEKILWEGKPDKKAFILEGIFNPLLPVAIIWLVIDMFFLGFSLTAGGGFGFIVVPFIILHLMPVWIYLFGALLKFREYRNTNYIVTDRGVYISNGLISKRTILKPFTEVSYIETHQGIVDQFLNVGDVRFKSAPVVTNDGTITSQIEICDIADYQEVFKLTKNLQTDIFADTMYPNDLRPKDNHGYNTEYKNDEQQ